MKLWKLRRRRLHFYVLHISVDSLWFGRIFLASFSKNQKYPPLFHFKYEKQEIDRQFHSLLQCAEMSFALYFRLY